jgi:hypothetical protein
MPLPKKPKKQETHLEYYPLMKDMARKFNFSVQPNEIYSNVVA